MSANVLARPRRLGLGRVMAWAGVGRAMCLALPSGQQHMDEWEATDGPLTDARLDTCAIATGFDANVVQLLCPDGRPHRLAETTKIMAPVRMAVSNDRRNTWLV
ncbi:hypothetical protein [Streptomyces sp. NPDC095613]|uniref:hypothetical protein n=1 Tax=Streptomyces sp. NPDC095613 TaxID=3155540 RepID=UPI00332C59C8